MRNLTKIIMGFYVFAAGGCASKLDVSPVTNSPVQGVVYSLPMTEFHIETSYQAVGCDKNDQTKFKVKATIDFESEQVNDPLNTYKIDLASMSQFTNKASTEVEFHEGTQLLKSINAKSEDSTIPFVSSVASTVLNVLTSNVTANRALIVGVTPPSVCSPGTPAVVPPGTVPANLPKRAGEGVLHFKLRQIKAQKDVVEAKTSELEDATKTVVEAAREQAELSPAVDPNVDAKLLRAVKLQKVTAAELAIESATLEKMTDAVSAKKEVIWPKCSFDLNKTTVAKLTSNDVQKWTDQTFGADPGMTLDEYDIHLSVSRLRGAGSISTSACGTANPPRTRRTNLMGLYYRNPETALLTFSRDYDDGGTPKTETIKQVRAPVAQLGFVNSLKIETRPFQSADFSATFAKTGAVLSAGYVETGTPAAALSTALDEIAEGYSTLVDARAGEELARQENEQKIAEAKLAAAKAEQDLDALTQSTIEEETSTIEAETALIEAEIAQIEAERKRAALLVSE